MSDFRISQISKSDSVAIAKLDSLLAQEGIKRDKNLDYSCAMFDDDYNIVATGSCYKNTLRCFAVSRAHQGEGLLNEIISHLIDYEYQRGFFHLFIYTKAASAKFFKDLGFYEIASVDGTLSFLENKRTGFSEYLKSLGKPTTQAGAVVMNANPFTLGHLFLVETAALQCETLHLFIVSEDESLVPFAVRKHLVMEGTAHIPNIVYHDSGSYIISSSTFPSYFLKDEEDVIKGHARLDIEVFKRISSHLGITKRFVGEEPFSVVTGLYNKIMKEELSKNGLECVIIPRKTYCGEPISASAVRRALKDGNTKALLNLVPKSTADFFLSDQATPIIEKIRSAETVVHY